MGLERTIQEETRKPGFLQRLRNQTGLVAGTIGLGLLSVLPASAHAEQRLQLLAHGNGKLGSVWQSDMAIYNPHNFAITVTAQATPHHQSRSVSDPEQSWIVQPRQKLVIRDVYNAVAGSGKGMFTVTATDLESVPVADPVVRATTYNLRPDGGEYKSFSSALSLDQFHGPETELADTVLMNDNERYNFQVSTLDDGATIKYTKSDGLGSNETLTVTYDANSTTQHVGSPFATDYALGDVITATVMEGDAIIAGTPVNNILGDANEQLWTKTNETYDITVWIQVLDNGQGFEQTTHPSSEVVRKIWQVGDLSVYKGTREYVCNEFPDPVVNCLPEVISNYNTRLSATEQQEFSGDRIGFEPFANDSDNDGLPCDSDEPDNRYVNIVRLTVTPE